MRVIVVEDNALLRAGLVELLKIAGFDVVADLGSADELLATVQRLDPQVVVLDIRMPPTFTREGLDAAREVRAGFGGSVGVLILTQYVEARHAVDLLARGAHGVGYLLKDRVLAVDELTEAVRRVGTGGSAIDPIVIEHLMKRRAAERGLGQLTERESEVLASMAEGLTNQAIATRLCISEKTVEASTSRIFSKLGLEPDANEHRRVRAVLVYLGAAVE